MTALPDGIVTFLFTDIEGSTRLVLKLGDTYPSVLEAYAGVLRQAIADSGGIEVSTEGDSFFAVFGSPDDALGAAVRAQRDLTSRRWPSASSVRVRMGVHTGRGVLGGDNYVGLDVHRAARIAGAGHGGQILVSGPARDGLTAPAAFGVTLRDLGLHRLKDLPEPEHLFQAQVPDLPGDFPPPRSLEVRPHNLPGELSDFIGRADETAAVEELLERARLLTLVGPGGTGKTRLGLRVAANVLPRFSDGVFFIPLWSIRDPDLVIPAIANQVGVAETADQPLIETLCEDLSGKQVLLLIDTFEHVQPAAPHLTQLLGAASGLTILVTSRALLRVRGEQSFQVRPLSSPDTDGMDPAALLETDAVSLFVSRARSSDPHFSPSPEDVRAIAEITKSLDGLPLAIELAAARVRLFTPKQLLERLRTRPDILRADSADAPDHHQTLADSIAWSYELLNEADQAALRRLAVFASGFLLEAAEDVVAWPPVHDVVESVANLLDNSILQHLVLAGERRFTILNTIREFASARLGEAGERDDVAGRHARFFMELAEEAEPHLTGDDQAAWFERLSAEMDNLRAALSHSVESGDTDSGLRLGGAIWRLWNARGQPGQGRQWLERLLAEPGATPEARAKGLAGLAGLAYWQADYAEARSRYEEALGFYRELGDRFGEADMLFALSTTSTWMGDQERGARLADQSLAIFEQLGTEDRVGMVIMAQGFALWMQGDMAGARPLWEKSLEIALKLGDHIEAATKTLALASFSFNEGEQDHALETALGALQELSDLRNVSGMVMALDWVAAFLAPRDPERGVRLAGAAAALRTSLGGGMRPESVGLEGARTVGERALPDDVVERLWSEGHRMSLEEAVSEALQVPYVLVPATVD